MHVGSSKLYEPLYWRVTTYWKIREDIIIAPFKVGTHLWFFSHANNFLTAHFFYRFSIRFKHSNAKWNVCTTNNGTAWVNILTIEIRWLVVHVNSLSFHVYNTQKRWWFRCYRSMLLNEVQLRARVRRPSSINIV